MASIGKDRNGTRRILFVDPADRRRRTLRLGRCSQRQAQAVKAKVEHLVAAKLGTGPLDDETSRWLGDITDELHARLAAVDLVEPRESTRDKPLGEFLREYIDGRTDIKPQTAVHMGHTVRNLIACFGASKPLREIAGQDALDFRAFLVKTGLAEATIRRRRGLARQFFYAAMERKLVDANPFKTRALPTAVHGNPQQQFFITRAMTDQILAACPDGEWRLLVSLARYGGLRTPSESLRLRWRDVDWERGRFTVFSPKTEHHSGHECRVVPLFPEIREALMQVFEAAQDGAEYCITRYRLNTLNLRTQFTRIVRRAGFRPWPRLWQNCRSSRQTELCEQFPEHVVCQWLGNSRIVARGHYLQTLDLHFQRAAQCAQNAAQSRAASGALSGTGRDVTRPESPENNDMRVSAGTCRPAQKVGMGDAGFEPATG